MESKSQVVNFGKSLIVPSVQELIKEPISSIPPRYIHSGEKLPTSEFDDSSSSVPEIDLRLLLGNSGTRELEKLHSACQHWGFFQIVNHGVSDSLLETFRNEVVSFFELPIAEKRKLWQEPDNQEGFGQLFVVSEDQRLDWCDMFYITTLPPSLRKIDLFESLPAKLRDVLEVYCTEMKKLAMTLLSQLAKALKIDDVEIQVMFKEGLQLMRMNYYPPCPERDLAMGFSPHSDADALTILFQLNETEGLQIRKDSKWVSVKPLRNSFVVNIGDIMEIVSNGVYKSIEHRSTVNSSKERLSVATFYSPNIDSEFGPASSLIEPNNPPQFCRIRTDQYFKEFFARKLEGKSYIDFMKLGD